MKNSEYKNLYQACHQLVDGPNYRRSNYALNLINTAIDFQMNVVAVIKAMDYYSENIGFKSHRGLKKVVQRFPNTEKGNKRLSQHLWANNMWTRAEFLRVLINEFEARGVKGQKSLENGCVKRILNVISRDNFVHLITVLISRYFTGSACGAESTP